jgi:hypothetical protein
VSTFRLFTGFGRWAGTVDDVVHCAELAVAAIAEWQGQEPRTRITAEMANRTIEATSVRDFRESIATSDVPALTSIAMSIGLSRAGPRAQIRIGAGFDRAANVEVSGEDKVRTEGLFSILRPALGANSQPGPPLSGTRGGSPVGVDTISGYLSVMGFVATVAAGAAVFVSSNNSALAIPVVIALVGFVAFAMLVAWAMPAVEFLKPGQQPRLRRVRGWIGALVLAFVLALAAAALFKVAGL